jgi:hypothetical protein
VDREALLVSKLGTYNAEALGAIVAPPLDAAISTVEAQLRAGNTAGFGISSDDMRKIITAAKVGRDFCRAEIARQFGSFS